jgi:hypothetical protein
LQFLQPLIDIRKILVTFAAYDGSDVVPQSNEKAVLVAESLISSGYKLLLILVFRQRACITEKTGVFQSAGTAPDDRLFASVVPMYPEKNLAVFAADDYL